MPFYEFEGKRPSVHPKAYVHPSAEIIGDVTISAGCHIGPGAVLRADFGTIVIGTDSSIEDNCVLHVRPGETTAVGSHVTVGHGSILHSCSVHSFAIIGMGGIVTDFADVGRWAVLAEGAVVKTRGRIPPGKLAAGVPARVIGDVSSETVKLWKEYKKLYPGLARKRYPEGLRECAPEEVVLKARTGCLLCGGELSPAPAGAPGECFVCGEERDEILVCPRGHHVCAECARKDDREDA
jgi:carbonic anhydrase/acetyltransferase-like protein (isoleucine patch superfamily)